MRRRDRLVRWLGLALLLASAPIVALAGTVAATGTITVAVVEHASDGTRIWIPVPALLADLGLMAVGVLAPAEALDEVRRETGEFLPVLREVARELERLPDATLVEVETDGETVRVRKVGGDFEIDVRSRDVDVSVQVPARLFGRTLALLA